MESNVIFSKTIFHNNKNYEVKVFQTDSGYTARVYYNAKPINPYLFSIENKELWNGHWDTKDEACLYLIDIAERDLKSNIWEKYKKSHDNNSERRKQ